MGFNLAFKGLNKDILASHKWLSSMKIMCLLVVSSKIQAMACSVYISFKSMTVFCLKISPPIVKLGFLAGHGKFLYHMAMTDAVWVTV
jgi:hypothetical protein